MVLETLTVVIPLPYILFIGCLITVIGISGMIISFKNEMLEVFIFACMVWTIGVYITVYVICQYSNIYLPKVNFVVGAP